MGAFQFLAFILLMGSLKGCGLFEGGKTSEDIHGVTMPFYKTSTVKVPVNQNPDAKSDSLPNLLYKVHLRVLRKLMNGQLKGYEQKALKREYALEKLKSRARLKGYKASEGSLTNQEFRDNFIKNIDRQRFHAYGITLQWNWDPEKQQGRMTLVALTPYFRPSVSGIAIGEQPLASVRYQSVLNHLKPDLKERLQDAIRRHFYGQLQESEVSDYPLDYKAKVKEESKAIVKRTFHFRTDSSFTDQLGRQFAQIQAKILDAAREGSLPVYKSDSLKEAYSSGQAVRRIRADKEVIKVLKGMGDEQYYGDTTIYNQISDSQFKRYWLLERWKRVESGVYRLKPLALAPVYRPERGGVTLNGTSLFWARMTDLEAVLKAKNIRWLQAYSYFMAQQQLAADRYSL